MKLATRRKNAQQFCFVQTAVGTIILPTSADKHSRKTVYCKRNDQTKEYCPAKRLDSFKQNQTREFQVHYGEQPRLQLAVGAPRTEEHETLVPNQYQWSQQAMEKGAADRLASHGEFKNQGYYKPTRLQDGNVTTAPVNSNSSEISRAMEKILETNQIMAKQQITQQRVLLALLLHQKQSNETQEAAQIVQTEALRALANATEQRGYYTLFNRITKFDGKDPPKCHFLLNQVHVACLESGRNF